MITIKTYDYIVIGSGHNGLIAAAYLTRAGHSVLILEKNQRPGGFLLTEEVTLPGFKHDVYSSAHPLFVTGPVYKELGEDLTARGLNYINTDLPTGVSMEDGKRAVLPRSFDGLIAEAERLSPGDGMILNQMMEEFNPYVNDIFTLFNMDLSSRQANSILKKLLHGSFASTLFSTARHVVQPFQSPVMQSMLASWVTHLGRTPDEVGSGIWVYLVLLALLAGGMPTPEGGSEKLSEALTKLIKDQGGVIKTQTLVQKIMIRHSKAAGVQTANDEEFIAAKGIIATTTPDQLYLSLLADSELPNSLYKQAKQFRFGRGCFQIHLALKEPPAWPDSRFHQVGQPHLTDGLNGFTLPSRAPKGNSILRIQVLEVPCRPKGDAAETINVGDGTWTPELTQRFTERILNIVSKHIPNVPDAIIGKYVVTPNTIAAYNPNTGPGDPYGGAHDLSQSFLLRPLPGQPGHQTIIPNLYMVGAATWPGHGINGGSGYIVARKILSQH